MTPIYLIKNTVFAFLHKQVEDVGTRVTACVSAYKNVYIRLPRAQDRTPCLLDTDWPLAGKVIVPGA